LAAAYSTTLMLASLSDPIPSISSRENKMPAQLFGLIGSANELSIAFEAGGGVQPTDGAPSAMHQVRVLVQ
jgi:hypothetical protein